MIYQLLFIALVATVINATPEMYCANYLEVCPEHYAFDFIADNQDCIDIATSWMVGAMNATDGNNLNCRLYHIDAANTTGDTGFHCPHASVSGGGACGTWCDNYCHVVDQGCDEWDSSETCLETCSDFIAADGMWNTTGGANVQCRTYHASVAWRGLLGGADVHCPHAGFTGGDVCGSFCDNLCQFNDAICGAPETNGECLNACAFMPNADIGTIEDNSVQCRLYHLSVAATNATAGNTDDIHCPHAGVEGTDGVCGSDCEILCDYQISGCLGGNTTLFTEREACVTLCEALPAGEDTDQGGNSVTCRLYHTATALRNMEESFHCPHGELISGGDVCGTQCQTFCSISMETCPSNYGGNMTLCEETCADFGMGNTGDDSGDTFECRMYHLQVATLGLLGGADVHCPHASEDGGDVCVMEGTMTMTMDDDDMTMDDDDMTMDDDDMTMDDDDMTMDGTSDEEMMSSGDDDDDDDSSSVKFIVSLAIMTIALL